MKKSKYFEWNAWYETIQNKLRSYWFHSSQHTDTVKVISILSPIAFNDLCKQFRHYKNHIFFSATWSRYVKSERKKNMSAPNCVISIWQFARGRWITHELPFNNSAKKCWNVRKLSHRLSLSIACPCERACVSEYAWVWCVCVLYRCECYCWWMLTGAVDIANCVYRIQNAFNCMRPSSPHQKVKFWHIQFSFLFNSQFDT